MKILIDIPCNEVDFGMKVLKSLSFVKKAKTYDCGCRWALGRP